MKLFDSITRNRRHIFRWCFGVSLLAVSGCTSMMSTPSITKALPWAEEKQKYIVPNRLAGTWESEQLYQQGKPPVRGFGGRFFFEGKDHDGPIEVEGTVTVYVFDDENPESAAQKPIVKYVITAEQLSRHHSKTKQGEHSYSLWLPWGKVGGPQRMLSLVVRFDGKKGEVVMSNGSRKILPGTQETVTAKMDQYTSPYSALQKKMSASTSIMNSRVQQTGFQNSTISSFDRDVMGVAYQKNDASTKSAINRLDTKTIDVPPNFGRGGQPVTGSKPNSSFIEVDQNSDRSATLENPVSTMQNSTMQNSMQQDQTRLMREFKQWQQRQQNSVPQLSRQQFADSRNSSNANTNQISNTRNRFGANDTKGFHQNTTYGAFSDSNDWKTKAPAYSSSASRQARFSRSRFRARDSRIGRPRLGPGRTQPTPIGWPSGLSQSQQSNLTNGANLPSTNEPPSYDSWRRQPAQTTNR